MPSSDYYRRQADICLKYARATDRGETSARLIAMAEVYNAKGDLKRLTWVFRRLTELLPNSGDLKLQLAIAYAKQDDKTNAYDTLLHMQVQGFGYDIGKDPRFASIHGTKVWDYLVANLAVNEQCLLI